MPPPVPPWSLFLAVLRSPRTTLAAIAARGEMREGRAAMLVLGIAHAGFSLLLYLAGHAPRMGIPGFPREPHYLWQAIFIIPLYIALFWIGGLVAHAVARRFSGSGNRDASLAVFGVAYALPMIVLFVIPDLIVFLTLGFTAIGKAMRWYAPLAASTCVWLGALGLSRAHNIGKGRAAIAALTGFVIQAIVGGVFLR
jgi:Yip1 domain